MPMPIFDAARNAIPGAEAQPHRGEQRPSVLIVDPDPRCQDFCRQILGEAGFEVGQAAGSAEAQDLIEQRPPDVILVDAAACHGDVRAWAHCLKASPLTRDVPLILIVPADSPAEATADLDAGVDDCIMKPLRDGELVLRVRSAARLRQHRREELVLRELRGEQARMWGVLLDFSRSMARVMDLDTVLERIVTKAAEMTSSRRVSLMLPDESRKYLTIAKAVGIDEKIKNSVRVPIGNAVAGRAFASGRRLTTAEGTWRHAPAASYSGDSFVSIPIVASSLGVTEKRVGVLNITDRYDDRPFEEWEFEYVDLLGSVAGSAIDDTLWRRARDSLLKYERDLQVARRIQQSTFPKQRPKLSGFELDAWSKPAQETGGDTYDIIGYQRDENSGAIRLSTGEADGAFLLLADATGHGIGPALSVTQVQAMLRMAVRTIPQLQTIARHMNEQLCADLPTGRFITAWLGQLIAADHTLVSFSAGQGPLLHYDAARAVMNELTSDVMPLGIIEDLGITMSEPIPLAPGDIFAVISDGVFEARNPAGKRFGIDRVVEAIISCRSQTPTQILFELREIVAAFTKEAPATDDRTAIIIKRVAE